MRALRPQHLWLDRGKLVVAHAGLKARMIGQQSKSAARFALFGDTSGRLDEFGLPIRGDWAATYYGPAAAVYGHTADDEARWENETICIDTGCVFGGKLTALRWPERSWSKSRLGVFGSNALSLPGRRDSEHGLLGVGADCGGAALRPGMC